MGLGMAGSASPSKPAIVITLIVFFVFLFRSTMEAFPRRTEPGESGNERAKAVAESRAAMVRGRDNERRDYKAAQQVLWKGALPWSDNLGAGVFVIRNEPSPRSAKMR
ncbi:hypothetical protein HPB48_003083 [Haemaphysalis longicornis]|uniref:Uncharacterized protein n=1 Tax=Haemaphysalis longicornis TaxID=44386 RepID=A0A9J6G2S4_HAELO|nr:hypothetical protein HPB48_003083 [Haemaphysalis longicornis]